MSHNFFNCNFLQVKNCIDHDDKNPSTKSQSLNVRNDEGFITIFAEDDAKGHSIWNRLSPEFAAECNKVNVFERDHHSNTIKGFSHTIDSIHRWTIRINEIAENTT